MQSPPKSFYFSLIDKSPIFSYKDRSFKKNATIHNQNDVVVRRCTDTTNNQEYAIKIVKDREQEWYGDYVAEDMNPCTTFYCGHQVAEQVMAESCNNLFSSHIVRYESKELFKDEFVVITLYSGKNILEFKNQLENKRLRLFHIMELISQIMFALMPLHKENIVHRDVKPQNILILESSDIESRYSITLIDFGIARKVSLSEKVDENEVIPRAAMAGTPGFIAPECFSDDKDEDGQLSTKNDLWSCGSTIVRLLFDDDEHLDCDPKLLHGMIERCTFSSTKNI